jgi:SAM-dependent methyltransferase
MKYNFRNENLDGLYEEYATIKISNCISCDHNHFEEWAETGPYKAFKCMSCGLIFMNPQLNEAGLNNYYSNYIGKRRLSNVKKMEQRSEQYVLDAKLIWKFLSKGTILDVGCNGGFFLDALGGGYKRFGTELDLSAVQYAQKNFPLFGKNIFNGTLRKSGFSNNQFDLISMRGVIEHVLDPEDSIKEVSRILKSGGFYYICATPNGDSFSANLYRENWTLFHPIQHLWHFSPANLSMICERHGLKLIWKEFPYLGTPYENVKKDISQISKYVSNKDSSVSPAFFGNMMSLVFQKNR